MKCCAATGLTVVADPQQLTAMSLQLIGAGTEWNESKTLGLTATFWMRGVRAGVGCRLDRLCQI